MKRIFLLSILVFICASGFWLTRGERPLPKGADVSPQIALHRAIQLASFSPPIDPHRPDARLAEWQRALRRHVATLLPELPQTSSLASAAQRFAEELLGEEISPKRVIDVNASGLDIAATMKGHSISHSADSVFFILDEDGQRQMVIKAFVDVQHRRSLFMPQLAALNVWRHLDLQESDPMRTLGLARCQVKRVPCALLAMKVSAGRMITEYLQDLSSCKPDSKERAAAMTTAKEAVAALGRGLGELHLQQRGRYGHLRSSDGFVKDVRQLAEIVGPVYDKAGFDKLIDSAIARARSEALPLSYVHGGMNLKNALYDAESGRLTFIDTVYMPRSFDRHGRPCGFGIVDYTKFTKELMCVDPDEFSREETEDLIGSFTEAYLGVCPQPESLLYLSELRNHLREMEGHCKKPKNANWARLYSRGAEFFDKQLL